MGKKGRRHSQANQKKSKHRREAEETFSTPETEVEATKKCVHLRKAAKLGVLQSCLPHIKLGKCSFCEESQNADAGVCLCLRCGKQGCDRYSEDKHSMSHYESTPSHCLTVNLHSMMVWCYSCDKEVPVTPNTDLHECIKILLKALRLNAPNDPTLDVLTSIVLTEPRKKSEEISFKFASNANTIKGLVNLGNTCFFNAVMQNLFQTELLHVAMAYVNQPDYSQMIATKNDLPKMSVQVATPPGSLITALSKLLCEYKSSSPGPLSPKFLFSEICKKAPRFKGFQQQDSQELLRYLLDSVKTEQLRRIKIAVLKSFEIKEGIDVKSLPEKKKEIIKEYVSCVTAPAVDSLFSGTLDSIVVCHECHKESRVTESFLDLSLSLNAPQSEKGKLKAKSVVNVPQRNKSKNNDHPGENDNTEEDENSTKTQTLSKHQKKAAREARRKKGKKGGKRTLSLSTSEDDKLESKQENLNATSDESDYEEHTDLLKDTEVSGDATTKQENSNNTMIDKKNLGSGGEEVISQASGKNVSVDDSSQVNMDVIYERGHVKDSGMGESMENDSGFEKGITNNSVQNEVTEESGSQDKDKKESRIQNEDAKDSGIQNENTMDSGIQNEDTRDSGIQNEDVKDSGIHSEDAKDIGKQNEDTKDIGIQNENAMDSGIQNEDTKDSGIQTEEAKESGIQNQNTMDSGIQNEDTKDSGIQNENTMDSGIQNQNTIDPVDSGLYNKVSKDFALEEMTVNTKLEKKSGIPSAVTDCKMKLETGRGAGKSCNTMEIVVEKNLSRGQEGKSTNYTKNVECNKTDDVSQPLPSDFRYFKNEKYPENVENFRHTISEGKISLASEIQQTLDNNLLGNISSCQSPSNCSKNIPYYKDESDNIKDCEERISDTTPEKGENQLNITKKLAKERKEMANLSSQPSAMDTSDVLDKNSESTNEEVHGNYAKGETLRDSGNTCRKSFESFVKVDQTVVENDDCRCSVKNGEYNAGIPISSSNDDENTTKSLINEFKKLEITESNNFLELQNKDERKADLKRGEQFPASVRTLGPSFVSFSTGESSVQSCLSLFCSPEILKDKNKFACQECSKRRKEGRHEQKEEESSSTDDENSKGAAASKPKNKKETVVYTEATKQMLISHTPPVLTLHFKRFRQIGFGLRKVPKHVDFPLVLDLAPFCRRSEEIYSDSKQQVLYSLIGVVEHSGGLNCGHYTACIKLKTSPTYGITKDLSHIKDFASFIEGMWNNQRESNAHAHPRGGQWYHVSDSRVSLVTEARVLKSQAYMLFYERLPFLD